MVVLDFVQDAFIWVWDLFLGVFDFLFGWI